MNPRYKYDCKNCAHSWYCGMKWACMYPLDLSEPPERVKEEVNKFRASAGMPEPYLLHPEIGQTVIYKDSLDLELYTIIKLFDSYVKLNTGTVVNVDFIRLATLEEIQKFAIGKLKLYCNRR